MTRTPDSPAGLDLRDSCQIQDCGVESTILFRGVGLCDRHWSGSCQDGSTVLEYLAENLNEDAILAIDWNR